MLFTLRPSVDLADAWQVLLVKRDELASEGRWSLPGVLVSADETFEAAARRALRTKAGLDARNWHIEQLGTFGSLVRDTRARVISVAYIALVRSDDLVLAPGTGIEEIGWFSVRKVARETLAFDHSQMLSVAIRRIHAKLRYSWLAFQLLPETFSIPELRATYAAILDPSLLRLNTGIFKKTFSRLFATGALEALGQKGVTGRVGRPADLYRFRGLVTDTWDRELPWEESEPDRLVRERDVSEQL